MNECTPSTSSESTKSPPESKLLDSSEEELNKKYNEFSTFALNDPGHDINAIDITGLSLRGHDEKENSFNRGNLLELLTLRAKDKKETYEGLLKSKLNYTSARTQNEIIGIIKTKIIQDIVEEINTSSSFSLICDETTDIATKEQLSICVRYPFQTNNKDFKIKERFLGFVDVKDTLATTLFSTIKEYLENTGIDLKKMRGQAYDGASNMSGKFNGVSAKFKSIEPRAIYTHCHAHLIDLAILFEAAVVNDRQFKLISFIEIVILLHTVSTTPM
ncbi:zinc finger MYM-type protein 1-like [Chrysoperla carnea]|uniref:zinc finger MYM-type protein 1-like n=1 Tax=Chrysoperla carnea TaxID=189513 RepID=UPI001D0726E4|nr:zinc finger MYM-type protein 1-like [Chrysoperla carnea]